MQIDLSGLTGPLIDILGTVLTLLAAWLAVKLNGWLKIQSDSVLGKILDQAVTNGGHYAADEIAKLGQNIAHPVVRNQAVAAALNYVLPKIPETLDALGISEQSLKTMIQARLAKYLGVTDNAAPPALTPSAPAPPSS